VLIAISVVSHGQEALLSKLLDDLRRVQPEHVTQIIVTHNLPPPEGHTPISIEGIEVCEIFNRYPKGFGANHNSAFRYSNTPLFAILNPDIRISDDPFSVLIRAFDSALVGLVAPKILNTDGSVADSARNSYTPIDSLRGLLGIHRLSMSPVWVAGMFQIYRSSAFRNLKGFDEGYFMYVEDVDICARLRLAQWAVLYDPSVAVVHDARRANRASLVHFKWHASSALRWWCGPVFWRSVMKALVARIR
jgi:N-acetylglucosaminyl-diphospho-decaprenol L-rhamnosyltransferase